KFPVNSAIGSQADYIANASINSFQPMNTNFGLFPELGFKHKKKERKMLYANRALEAIDKFIKDEKIDQ
ncbi:MAG: methylenetetrahydrofolate--tRNA-(uracil(54)-C(5))-methyltransferase (FADH(2)-oxidizing) TrmFO, partial [Bacillota bacterium]